jgi:WS/DGAT/MGAT family acyltransferase
LTVNDIRRLISERLHLLGPFRWRLVEVPFALDHPYWIEDPEFDVEYHVRELALPQPGDDRQLGEQVARIHSRPLDRARPLWELYVISGLAGGRVALLTKMHHAAVDGMSGAEILSVLLDPSPEGRELPPAPKKRSGESVPGQREMLARGLAGIPRQPLRALGAIPRTLPNLDEVPTLRTVPGVGTIAGLSRRALALTRGSLDGGVLESPRVRAPRTIFNRRISAHRRVAFASMSLGDVKAVKDEFGLKVNDVVVAMCAGALRSWLSERDALPTAPLLAMIPVSVRTPEQFGTYGNRVSTMIVAIPTDEPDPRKRLERASEAMMSAKDRHKALPASLLQDANHFIPPAVFARAARVTSRLAARDPAEPPVNLVISNVPGSPTPLYCGGARLLATYPVSAILDGVGLNITVFSYLDSIDFGVVGDRDQVQDAWPLIAALRAELDELTSLLPKRRKSTAAPEERTPV